MPRKSPLIFLNTLPPFPIHKHSAQQSVHGNLLFSLSTISHTCSFIILIILLFKCISFLLRFELIVCNILCTVYLRILGHSRWFLNIWVTCVYVRVPAQSCLGLCDPMDCGWPGFSVHGIFQERMMEWVAISYSRGSSRPRDRTASLASPALAGGFFTTSPTLDYF